MASSCCLVLLLAGCISVGAEFPTPTVAMIKNGVTTRAELLQLFSSPTQVGIEDGDQTWTWVYVRAGGMSRPLSKETLPTLVWVWQEPERTLSKERGPTEFLPGKNAETDRTCGGISEGFHLAEARRVAPRGGRMTASCRTLERIRDFVHPHKIRTSQ